MGLVWLWRGGGAMGSKRHTVANRPRLRCGDRTTFTRLVVFDIMRKRLSSVRGRLVYHPALADSEPVEHRRLA